MFSSKEGKTQYKWGEADAILQGNLNENVENAGYAAEELRSTEAENMIVLANRNCKDSKWRHGTCNLICRKYLKQMGISKLAICAIAWQFITVLDLSRL